MDQMATLTSATLRSVISSLRLSSFEKETFAARAKEKGYRSLSDYFRALAKADLDMSANDKPKIRLKRPISKFHSTKLGSMWNGDSLDWMAQAKASSVDLVMTSPPFGLVRKKTYGNEDAHLYCDWFRPFAEEFKRILKKQGSLVIDIGGAWKAGLPTRSLYHFELLIMLCEEYGFHLCQEHYWGVVICVVAFEASLSMPSKAPCCFTTMPKTLTANNCLSKCKAATASSAARPKLQQN